MSEENNIKNTVNELKNLLDSQSFIGKTIETEDKILIPVMRMGFSFGAGKGLNKDSEKNGAAAVAGIEPLSMVVITKNVKGIEGVRVLNLNKGTAVNKALTDLDLVVSDIIKDFTNKNNKQNDNPNEHIKENEKVDKEPKETTKIDIKDDNEE